MTNKKKLVADYGVSTFSPKLNTTNQVPGSLAYAASGAK
jgi:hypothetical protein